MSTPGITLVHRDDPTCPAGPRGMMDDGHRVGCSNGRSCPSPRPVGGVARATYYAKQARVLAGKRATRAMYFCDRCGAAFAQRHGLPFAGERTRG